jgi:hypothetical protein
MDQRFRRGFTAAEKTELWDRWQRGESLKAIGRAFGKPSSSIYNQVVPHGGIRPASRRRSRLALTLLEREEISRGIAVHQSARSMARLLGRSASTVSRELNRNGGYDRYRAAPARTLAFGPIVTTFATMISEAFMCQSFASIILNFMVSLLLRPWSLGIQRRCASPKTIIGGHSRSRGAIPPEQRRT